MGEPIALTKCDIAIIDGKYLLKFQRPYTIGRGPGIPESYGVGKMNAESAEAYDILKGYIATAKISDKNSSHH